MGLNFRTENREQGLLFPPSVEDWVPEGHEVRFVREVILGLDASGGLEAFYASYNPTGRGGSAFHPITVLCVLVYGYSIGVTSSRKLARALEDSVAFRYLAANQLIDFRTLAKFRRRHLAAFEVLFSEVLQLCAAAGLVSLGRVAIDGRRVPANASRDTTVTGETIDAALEALAKEIVEAAETLDAEEDERLGDRRGDELPAGLRTKADRKRRLEAAREVLRERERKILEAHEERLRERERYERETGKKKNGPAPNRPDTSRSKNRKAPPKANTTDPDSRLMKVRNGFIQGYNAQIAVDGKSQIVVAQRVTQDTVDTRQLEPMLRQIHKELGELPGEATADAGYWSPANAGLQDELGVEIFLATQKDSRQRAAIKKLKAPRGRIPNSATARERMTRKLLTKRGKEAYRTRGPTVEGVFGQMVNRDLRRFVLRGLEGVSGEWALFAATHNLLKLFRAL